MKADIARGLRDLFERAVYDLATGPGHIQQRLAEAYLYCHLGDDANMYPGLFPEVFALQMDLRAAMTTVHDAERGAAAASAAQLSDDDCVVFAQRILHAAATMRNACRNGD